MKKNAIFIILTVLSIGGYLVYTYLGTNTLQVTNTIEEPSFTIQLPKKYYLEEENSYTCDETAMFVDFRYFSNELQLDMEAMIKVISYNEFYEDDIISIEEVSIDGQDVFQAEYKTLGVGRDDIHYYYLGVITIFELEDEVLIVDAYQSMDESMGISSTISDKNLQLLNDIINTVEITDNDYNNTDILAEKVKADSLVLNLSNKWEEAVEGENGYYDFGYYATYGYDLLPIYLEIDEYNDANINDLEYIENAVSEWSGYSQIGEGTLGGEAADVYAYEADSGDGNSPYIYGVFVASEHYWADFYFYMYDEDYEFSNDSIDTIIDFLQDIR